MIPKFRVWNKKTESFIDYGDLMLDLKNAKVYAGDVGIPEYTIDVTKQVILMQYTGLKDENGVEIFEGDIVKVGTLEDEPIGYIKWIPKSAEYKVINHINPFGEEHVSFYHAKLFEVIGTLYENPELLETSE